MERKSWNSIFLKQPENGQRVLCYFDYSEIDSPNVISENTFYGERKPRQEGESKYRWLSDSKNVTHWCKLPCEPKDEIDCYATLGKIDTAFFGSYADYNFMMGLELSFSLSDGGCVGTGGKYSVNVGESCKWERPEDRQKAISNMVAFVREILKDAKVNTVDELVGKPVEVVIKKRAFESFRILKEVL